MFGLALFGGLALFAAAVVALSVWAGRSARRRGRNGALWGSAVFVLLMLPLFWDYVPTLLLHRKLCAEEAGVKVFVPFEKWVEENGSAPVAAVPLEAKAFNNDRGEGVIRLNERISITNKATQMSPWPVFVAEERLFDDRSGVTLAAQTLIYTGTEYGRRSDWFRLWMSIGTCGDDSVFRAEMRKYSGLTRGPP